MRHPRLIAALDQLGAVLRDVAPALAAYHKQLREQGLTSEEATALVVGVQEFLLRTAGEARKVGDE